MTLPWEPARAVAFDAELCGRVFGLWAEEIARWQCSRARAAGVDSPRTGCVLELQRFADGASLWPHAHLLAPDGVFFETADGRVRFRGIGPPKDEDVEANLLRVTERVRRLLKRRAQARANDEELADAERLLLFLCAAVDTCAHIVIEGSGGPDQRKPKGSGARRRKPLCGIQARVATVGHLIAMKLLSRRPDRKKDEVDLDSLLAHSSERDLKAARDAVRLIVARAMNRGRDLLAELDALSI